MTYRLTASLMYRSGATVLVQECASLNSLDQVGGALRDHIAAAATLDRQSKDDLDHGNAELVIRVARRSFAPYAEDHLSAPSKRRTKLAGEF